MTDSTRSTGSFRNRLQQEKSPICSSMPPTRWTGIPGGGSLRKARREDKPIFLSIVIPPVTGAT